MTLASEDPDDHDDYHDDHDDDHDDHGDNTDPDNLVVKSNSVMKI